MFSLLKYFFTYSAIIAMKFCHYIPEVFKMILRVAFHIATVVTK